MVRLLKIKSYALPKHSPLLTQGTGQFLEWEGFLGRTLGPPGKLLTYKFQQPGPSTVLGVRGKLVAPWYAILGAGPPPLLSKWWGTFKSKEPGVEVRVKQVL